MDDYIEDMKALIYPIVNDENVRADTVDICYNIKQIENPIEKLRDNAGVTCSGNYYTIPASETPEAKLQREKYENNYEKLENFRRYKLVILSQKLKKNLRKIWKIYNHHVKEFEERDNEYRIQLNKLYDACTDTLDKYFDTRAFLDSVTWEFVKPLMGIAAFTVLAIFTPEVAIACLVLPVIGCITLASVPKQYVPKWLQGAKDDSDAIVNIVKGGPKSIVEAIGQGLMDEVQTPQGVASVSGTVAGMALSGPLSKKFGPKIKAARGKVDAWKSKSKSGKGLVKISEIINQSELSKKHFNSLTYKGTISTGGRSGNKLPKKSTPNSYYITDKGHVIIYGDDGYRLMDISADRIKIESYNVNPNNPTKGSWSARKLKNSSGEVEKPDQWILDYFGIK